MRNWLKKHNIGLWAISFLVALMLWGYVTWYLNPVREESLTGIKVEFSGEAEYLNGRNLCIIEGKEQTFTLTFTGRQADLNKLKRNRDKVKIRVDVSGIQLKGEKYPVPELVLPDEVGDSVEVKQLPYVRVVIDSVVEQDVEVVLKDSYQVAQGYVALPPVFEPYSIRVRGPESVLRTVACAEVELVHANIDKSIENEDLVYNFVDENGERVEQTELLTASVESVKVSLPIRMTKEVPLRIKFIDGGGLKENENIVCNITPSVIELYGLAEDLEELNAIYLATIDLAELEDVVSEPMVIPLKENVGNLSGVKEAEVSVTFRGVAAAEVSTSNIQVVNAEVPDGYKLVVVQINLPVRIRGAEDVVGLVQPDDIRVVVDLAGKTLIKATQLVSAKVYIDDAYKDSVGVMGTYEVAVRLVEDTEGG